MTDTEKNNNITDSEAAEVTGGANEYYVYPNEDGPEFDSKFRFKVGDHIEYITGIFPFINYEFTDGGKVLHRSHDRFKFPVYQCSGLLDRDEYSWIDETFFQ